MSDAQGESSVAGPVVALAGWLLPGAGYWLLGQRAGALTVGVTIIILFLLGILIAGIRVIDVPGFDENGAKVMVRTSGPPAWVLTNHPISEVLNKPWFIGQVLAGPIGLIAAERSIWAAQANPPYPKVHARLAEIGTLYTAVAGMLNLLAMIDAAYRAGRKGQA